jgi:EAL domain-containing protein (putative c-di-GMP-specific phosphodiesterase class I)
MGRTYVGYRGAGPFDLPPFVIAYQPIVNFATRSIVAYEALTRGVNGTPYPELTAHLNASALRAFHRRTAETAILRAAELGLVELNASLCVNMQPDLHPDALDSDFVLEAAHRAGLSPSNILLEFTEDHRLSIPEYKQLLTRNKEAGFATGMDDFGAGYSGLSALVECRPEVLKLDRALVRGIDTSDTRQKIVEAFAKCSKALDMRLIAEGIETVEECRMLVDLGIIHMQGYLFSRPVPDELPVENVWGIDRRIMTTHSGQHPEQRPSLLDALSLAVGMPALTLQA